MKKRNNLIIVCLAVIIIAGSGIVYKNYFTNIDSNNYLSTRDESERNITGRENGIRSKNSYSFDFKKFDGKWSLMEFKSSKGNKINIKDNTKINKGKFFIAVLDSEYNIITKKDETNQKGDINFTTPKDGKYLIRIVGLNAGGKFDISVNSAKNIDISHKDFFD
ncbi:hypothetical protein [Clostridium botulinum]|uniref:Uncharacterized protein n=3 Tax=Clostridium botulinum TaxID=1491 RepID=A0A6B4B236_CLOBO|nr:hypothetical protein [Clostridium botulinum]ACQ53046.1 conserved hypothetical protein [Clostridium botulinum Ba4 str. 657]AJE12407.1 hypothetical protein T259_3397 [Clostridium botulinum CDC_1436]APC81033.1 hypothetical protein NPD2_3330 [Clostridium botulinum]APC83564.1 hypothetical protein NPD12_1175 [Clostridium botulinum]AXG91832.1 hypothetical protein AGE29_08570 [Clostridium botulinum]